jgi:hypothetical protein
MSGEPGGGRRSLILSKHYDLVLSMEILRQDNPENVFYIAIDEDTVMYNNITRTSLRPIDVMYSSSHCDVTRERMVHVIRQKLEEEGLRFEYNGRCNAGSRKPRYKFAPHEQPALESKMMIAISRSQDPHTEALDEKLSKAMKFGCIAIYQGVGQRLAHSVQNYPRGYLDRQQYNSDSDFANAIVRTLRDPVLLDFTQQQFVQHKWEKMRFCKVINDFILRHPPSWIHSNTSVSIAKNDGASLSNKYFLEVIECVFKSATPHNYTWVHKFQEADIEINHCCFG